MTRFRIATFALTLMLLAIAKPPAVAQDTGAWPLEEVVTVDGKKYRGLIHAQHEGEIEFIEVVQPRGKPMYLVVRPIDVSNIASKQQLPDKERKQLQDRVHAFRFRSRIEAGRMENVQLDAREDSGRNYLRFHGPWFTVDSTADDETTRRCVVRIVQIFCAYRQMLPPRREAEKPLRILLFASMDQYRDFLEEHDLEVTNPAVYSQRGNLIAAASELSRYAQRLEVTRQQHEAMRVRLAQLDKELPGRLAEIRTQLADASVPRRAIDDEINARTAQWEAQRAETMQSLNAADRRNARRFNEVTDEMFTRLYHEAFHAYLENYLYPDDQYDVPTWLHEGLAQLFQSGQLEGDTLRIDAPLASAQLKFQDDLNSEHPIALAELLRATRRDFLAGDERANRLYAHAWALAYYLAFFQPVFGTPEMDAFVARDADDPVARFQKLIDMPLAKFETQRHRTVGGDSVGEREER